MGAFYSNMTLRTDDLDAVTRCLEQLRRTAYVSHALGGWIVVFDETCDRSAGEAKRLGSLLAQRLRVPAFVALNHDDSVFCYWLFDEDGDVRDAYASNDLFEDAPRPGGGDAHVLCEVLRVDPSR